MNDGAGVQLHAVENLVDKFLGKHPGTRWLFAASLPVATIAMASVIAPWFWIGELCLHLSWQASLALLPALIAVRRERWRAGLLFLAMLCGILPWITAAYETRAPVTVPGSAGIRLATANLYDFNPQRERALARILELEVDLMALNEVLPPDEAVLSGRWPYIVWSNQRGLLSSALLSRFPIVWSHVHDLDEFALVEALVQTPQGPLRILVVHLASPKRPEKATRRDRQLQRLAGLARESADPLVIAGDFNLCVATSQWRQFVNDARVLRPAGAGPATWPTWLGPMGLDLDHVAGRGVAMSPLQSFRIPGSDHRGLITLLTLP